MARLIKRRPFHLAPDRKNAIEARGVPGRICLSCTRKFHPSERFPHTVYCDSHCLFVGTASKKTVDLYAEKFKVHHSEAMQFLTTIRGL